MNTDELLNLHHWRYATKQFDASKFIPEETWLALEHSLVLTPSSFGLQPWKFIVVRDPALRERLKAASWGQSQVTDCSHHVVFAIRTDVDEAFVDANLQRMAEVRGVSVESLAGFKKVVMGFLPKVDLAEWATRQVYIALGNFMTSAAFAGVDTCPMEGIDPAQYDTLLDLPSRKLKCVVACAAGYRSEEDKYAALPKVRFLNHYVIEHI